MGCGRFRRCDDVLPEWTRSGGCDRTSLAHKLVGRRNRVANRARRSSAAGVDRANLGGSPTAHAADRFIAAARTGTNAGRPPGGCAAERRPVCRPAVGRSIVATGMGAAHVAGEPDSVALRPIAAKGGTDLDVGGRIAKPVDLRQRSPSTGLAPGEIRLEN